MAVSLLAGCQTVAPQKPPISELGPEYCSVATTPLSEIQGDSSHSPLWSQRVTASGVVTFLVPGTGLFMEQTLADNRRETSDGVFVANAELATKTQIGQQLVIVAGVDELAFDTDPANHTPETPTLTSLTQVSGYRVCATGEPLPLHDIALPLSATEQESLEAMRVELVQDLVALDIYGWAGRGIASVAPGEPQWAATEVVMPGEAAMAHRQANRTSRLVIRRLDDTRRVGATDVRASGDRLLAISGVMADGPLLKALLLESYSPLGNPQPSIQLPQKSGLRIMSFNVENLFNGDGMGGGFPTDRGAQSAAEYAAQLKRISTAIAASQADIVALQELENDGYGETSAVASLVASLNAGLADAPWAFVAAPTPTLGDDSIAVGLIYRHDRVMTAGPGLTLAEGEFGATSRQPLGQLFADRATGNRFLMVSNHFKSKGSCPPDGPNAAQGDGQACWNAARLRSAQDLSRWVNAVGNILSTKAVLLLGDFNANRMEDPIRYFETAGWTSLAAHYAAQDSPPFTYVFRGSRGTLDYAFASPQMARMVGAASVWPINAIYADGVQDGYLRASDHDPVIVDLLP